VSEQSEMISATGAKDLEMVRKIEAAVEDLNKLMIEAAVAGITVKPNTTDITTYTDAGRVSVIKVRCSREIDLSAQYGDPLA
jgi:hypothetical protein